MIAQQAVFVSEEEVAVGEKMSEQRRLYRRNDRRKACGALTSFCETRESQLFIM
jgi:hypothetical protein